MQNQMITLGEYNKQIYALAMEGKFARFEDDPYEIICMTRKSKVEGIVNYWTLNKDGLTPSPIMRSANADMLVAIHSEPEADNGLRVYWEMHEESDTRLSMRVRIIAKRKSGRDLTTEISFAYGQRFGSEECKWYIDGSIPSLSIGEDNLDDLLVIGRVAKAYRHICEYFLNGLSNWVAYTHVIDIETAQAIANSAKKKEVQETVVNAAMEQIAQLLNSKLTDARRTVLRELVVETYRFPRASYHRFSGRASIRKALATVVEFRAGKSYENARLRTNALSILEIEAGKHGVEL